MVANLNELSAQEAAKGYILQEENSSKTSAAISWLKELSAKIGNFPLIRDLLSLLEDPTYDYSHHKITSPNLVVKKEGGKLLKMGYLECEDVNGAASQPVCSIKPQPTQGVKR